MQQSGLTAERPMRDSGGCAGVWALVCMVCGVWGLFEPLLKYCITPPRSVNTTAGFGRGWGVREAVRECARWACVLL